MSENHNHTPAEINFCAATDRLKAAFCHYEKPPIDRCVDMLNYTGDIPDEVRAAWSKSPWQYRADDMDFIRLSFCRSDYFPLVGELTGLEENARATKYWLPRLLYGLSNCERHMVMDDWYIIERLYWAKWPDWPSEEVEAVHDWCAAWLSACLDWHGGNAELLGSFSARSVPACLEFAISIGFDLTPELDLAVNDMQAHTARAIHDVVIGFAPEVIRREHLDDRSNRKAPALQALLKWMLQPTTNERLEGAFFRVPEGDRQLMREISETSDWIENVRKSYVADSRGLPNWLVEEHVRRPA
jgi:hypothetical protein